MKSRLSIGMLGWLLCPLVPAFAGYIVDLDYAVFRGDDSLSFLEVYAAVQRQPLAERLGDGDTIGVYFTLALELRSDAGRVWHDTLSGEHVALSADAKDGGSFFPQVFRFFVPPGSYDATASVFDRSEQMRERTTLSVTVRDLQSPGLLLSDIEAACALEFNAGESRHTKSSVLALSNASGFFGAEMPVMYYYAEAYGLDFDPARPDSFAVIRRVLHSDDSRPARPESRKVYKTPAPEAVIADGFPVSSLQTGTYLLELEVQSYRSGAIATSRRKFWTYREEDFQTGAETAGPAFTRKMLESSPGILEVLDPDSALRLMKYLMNREQSKQIGRLNADGKKEYLREYWRNRELLEPHAAEKYFARVAEANERFGVLNQPGWRTDRGRIFILHGEPTNITRNEMQSATLSNQIWEYDGLEGGVIFVFVDFNEYGDYELVHSTMRGEIYNPDWEQNAISGRRTRIIGADD